MLGLSSSRAARARARQATRGSCFHELSGQADEPLSPFVISMNNEGCSFSCPTLSSNIFSIALSMYAKTTALAWHIPFLVQYFLYVWPQFLSQFMPWQPLKALYQEWHNLLGHSSFKLIILFVRYFNVLSFTYARIVNSLITCAPLLNLFVRTFDKLVECSLCVMDKTTTYFLQFDKCIKKQVIFLLRVTILDIVTSYATWR